MEGNEETGKGAFRVVDLKEASLRYIPSWSCNAAAAAAATALGYNVTRDRKFASNHCFGGRRRQWHAIIDSDSDRAALVSYRRRRPRDYSPGFALRGYKMGNYFSVPGGGPGGDRRRPCWMLRLRRRRRVMVFEEGVSEAASTSNNRPKEDEDETSDDRNGIAKPSGKLQVKCDPSTCTLYKNVASVSNFLAQYGMELCESDYEHRKCMIKTLRRHDVNPCHNRFNDSVCPLEHFLARHPCIHAVSLRRTEDGSCRYDFADIVCVMPWLEHVTLHGFNACMTTVFKYCPGIKTFSHTNVDSYFAMDATGHFVPTTSEVNCALLDSWPIESLELDCRKYAFNYHPQCRVSELMLHTFTVTATFVETLAQNSHIKRLTLVNPFPMQNVTLFSAMSSSSSQNMDAFRLLLVGDAAIGSQRELCFVLDHVRERLTHIYVSVTLNSNVIANMYPMLSPKKKTYVHAGNPRWCSVRAYLTSAADCADSGGFKMSADMDEALVVCDACETSSAYTLAAVTHPSLPVVDLKLTWETCFGHLMCYVSAEYAFEITDSLGNTTGVLNVVKHGMRVQVTEMDAQLMGENLSKQRGLQCLRLDKCGMVPQKTRRRAAAAASQEDGEDCVESAVLNFLRNRDSSVDTVTVSIRPCAELRNPIAISLGLECSDLRKYTEAVASGGRIKHLTVNELFTLGQIDVVWNALVRCPQLESITVDRIECRWGETRQNRAMLDAFYEKVQNAAKLHGNLTQVVIKCSSVCLCSYDEAFKRTIFRYAQYPTRRAIDYLTATAAAPEKQRKTTEAPEGEWAIANVNRDRMFRVLCDTPRARDQLLRDTIDGVDIYWYGCSCTICSKNAPHSDAFSVNYTEMENKMARAGCIPREHLIRTFNQADFCFLKNARICKNITAEDPTRPSLAQLDYHCIGLICSYLRRRDVLVF